MMHEILSNQFVSLMRQALCPIGMYFFGDSKDLCWFLVGSTGGKHRTAYAGRFLRFFASSQRFGFRHKFAILTRRFQTLWSTPHRASPNLPPPPQPYLQLWPITSTLTQGGCSSFPGDDRHWFVFPFWVWGLSEERGCSPSCGS